MTRMQEAGLKLIKPSPIYTYELCETVADRPKFTSDEAKAKYKDHSDRYLDRYFGVRVAFPHYSPLTSYHFADDIFYNAIKNILPKDCEVAISGPWDQRFMDYLETVGLKHAYQVFVALPWFNSASPLNLKNLRLPKQISEVFYHLMIPEYEACMLTEPQWWTLLKEYNFDGVAISRYRPITEELFDPPKAGALKMSDALIDFMLSSKKNIYVYPDTAAMDSVRLNTSSKVSYGHVANVLNYIKPSHEEVEPK